MSTEAIAAQVREAPMCDEVDEITAGWRRARPDLDTEPMHIWSRIGRLAQLQDAARSKAFSAQGLQLWEFDVLAALRRSGEPYRLTPSQLIADTHVTSGTMTNRIQRLAEKRLVVRRNHPDDGRGALVELTDEGLAAVDEALSRLVVAEKELAAALSVQEQGQLADLLRILLLDATG